MVSNLVKRERKIWRSSLGRSNLRSLLWHQSRKNYDLADIGSFDEREEEYRKTNPEWFENDEDEEEYENDESEPDRIENLEHAIRKMAEEYTKRRYADVIWFLLAALLGSFIGAALWS